MSKVVFADNTEVVVNDVSSVYAITLDTVDQAEIDAFKEKLTIGNLKSVKIVNENPKMCSEGSNFRFVEIMRPDGASDEDPTSTTFLCRPMREIEKNIVGLADGGEATAAAVEELATLVAGLL